MSDWTPTTEDVREDYRQARIMGDRDPDAEFDRWLAQTIREAKAEALQDAADEAEQIILSGDIAESSAYVPGESGRQSAIDHRDALLEDPVAWLRQHAQNIEARQETDR